MRVDLTAAQVKAVTTMLADELGDETDDRLLLDSLEAETDLFELAGKLVGKIEDEEGSIKVLAEQMSDRKLRQDRAGKRIDSIRLTIQALMEIAGIDRLPLPEATVTLRKVAPKRIVQDEKALPDEYVRITRKPDLTAIRNAAETPAGCVMDNGGVSLTIRRK